MRVYWCSKHDLTPTQKKILASCDVVKDPRPFSNAEQIIKRFKDSRCDDIIVVAPLSVLRKMVEFGLRPVWAEMEETDSEHGEVCIPHGGNTGRWMRHKCFLRVKNVAVEFDDKPVTFVPNDPADPNLPMQAKCEACKTREATSRKPYDGWGWTSLCDECAAKAQEREAARKAKP